MHFSIFKFPLSTFKLNIDYKQSQKDNTAAYISNTNVSAASHVPLLSFKITVKVCSIVPHYQDFLYVSHDAKIDDFHKNRITLHKVRYYKRYFKKH